MTASPTAPRIARQRAWVLGAVFGLIGVAPALALVSAVRYYGVNGHNGIIRSSGEQREYILYVPVTYNGSADTPLVISLHGAGGWGAAQRETSRWNEVADRYGFIVVYPSGVSGDRPRVWRITGDDDGLARDVQFVSDLIDTLSAQYRIDPARIYATGLSNGGGMAFALSCMLGDRIAAFGLVAAAQVLPQEWCPDARPAPLIAFHGTGDRLVPFRGGPFPRFMNPHDVVFPAFRRWTATWARRNACAPEPTVTTAAADVTRYEYVGCAEGGATVTYVIEGGGHTWPGGGPLPEWLVGSTSYGVDASTEMWNFFLHHSLSGR